jgi:transposase
MGMARYVVDAVLLEGRGVREVAAAHGISRRWIYELVGRFRAGGYEALEPRSHRPCSCPHETPPAVVGRIVELRRELEAQGHDAGPATIAYHLASQLRDPPSRTTIWRILQREGLLTPQPQKRPRSSLIRFEADLPNEMWQADIAAWTLADGEVSEILNLIDDHSARTLSELQEQLDAFAHYYNAIRPHRALGGRTPLQAYSAHVKARPTGAPAKAYFRVRSDRVDDAGKVSLRFDSRLYKIGLGRSYKGRAVKLLIADRDIRVIDTNGELIRELTLDPSRTYQPLARA